MHPIKNHTRHDAKSDWYALQLAVIKQLVDQVQQSCPTLGGFPLLPADSKSNLHCSKTYRAVFPLCCIYQPRNLPILVILFPQHKFITMKRRRKISFAFKRLLSMVTDESIILKWILKNWVWGCEQDSSGSGQGQEADSCEHSSEAFGSK
jgi:hypothetical protein